jgi:Icc-related predicted phosphoesterase
VKKVGRELIQLPYRYIVYVPGNHDRAFHEDHGYVQDAWKYLPGIITLLDETVEILGLRIYGSSWIKYKEGKYPFEMEHIEEKWERIPSNTDILITHMPPLSGILDVNDDGDWRGSHSLLTTVRDRVKPKLHVFGHIHAGHGTYKSDDITYVNASLTGADRKPAFKPIVIEV